MGSDVMNCKPGDLARIWTPYDSPNRDRIVRCLRLLSPGEEMVLGECVFVAASALATWAVEGRIVSEGPDGGNHICPGGPIPDKYLRPIRDPGDDAKDESMSWIPVPSREEVSA
jgi:hypothetical protein